MQLIQTIWDVMALLTELDFLLETTCCCKRDRKERYWGQQFWQMARDRQRPVTVDHLQSWSQIFRSDQTEMVRSIWWTNRNFRTFGSNAKRPGFPNHSTLTNYGSIARFWILEEAPESDLVKMHWSVQEVLPWSLLNEQVLEKKWKLPRPVSHKGVIHHSRRHQRLQDQSQV